MAKESIIAFDISKYDNNVLLYYDTLYEDRDIPIKDFENRTLNQFNLLSSKEKYDFFVDRIKPFIFTEPIIPTIIESSGTLIDKPSSHITKTKKINPYAKQQYFKFPELQPVKESSGSVIEESFLQNKGLKDISDTSRINTKRYRSPIPFSPNNNLTKINRTTILPIHYSSRKKISTKNKNNINNSRYKHSFRSVTLYKTNNNPIRYTDQHLNNTTQNNNNLNIALQQINKREREISHSSNQNTSKYYRTDNNGGSGQKQHFKDLFSINNAMIDKKKHKNKRLKGGDLSNDYIKKILNSFKIRDIQHDFKIKIIKEGNVDLYDNFNTSDDNTAFIDTIVDLSSNGYISFDKLYFIFTLDKTIFVDNYLVLKKSTNGEKLQTYLETKLLTTLSTKFIYDGIVNIEDKPIKKFLDVYSKEQSESYTRVISPEILFDTMAVGIPNVKNYMNNIGKNSMTEPMKITDKVYNGLTKIRNSDVNIDIKNEYMSAFDLDTSELFNIVYFSHKQDIGFALLFLNNTYNKELLTKEQINKLFPKKTINVGEKRQGSLNKDERNPQRRKTKRGGDYNPELDYIILNKTNIDNKTEYVLVENVDYKKRDNSSLYIAIYIPIKENPFAKNNIKIMIDITNNYFNRNNTKEYKNDLFINAVNDEKNKNEELVSISILVLQYLIKDYHKKNKNNINFILNIIYNLKSSGDYGKVLYGYYNNNIVKNDDKKVSLITNDTLCGLHSILRENTDVITGAHRMETYYVNPKGDVRFLVIYKSDNKVKNTSYLIDKLNSSLNMNLSLPKEHTGILTWENDVKNWTEQIKSHFHEMVIDTDIGFSQDMYYSIIYLAIDKTLYLWLEIDKNIFTEEGKDKFYDEKTILSMEKHFNANIHEIKFFIADCNTYCTDNVANHESVNTLYKNKLNNLYNLNKRTSKRNVDDSIVFLNITLSNIILNVEKSSYDRKNTYLYNSIILNLIKSSKHSVVNMYDISNFIILIKYINSSLNSFKRFYNFILPFQTIREHRNLTFYINSIISLSDILKNKKNERFDKVLDTITNSNDFHIHLKKILNNSDYEYEDVKNEITKIFKSFMNDIKNIILIADIFSSQKKLTPINYIV